MRSERFMVNSDAQRMAAARYATEGFARRLQLGRHDALRLDLLVEETLGMVKTMVDSFYGEMWFEADGDRCEIHLDATTDMDAQKREELLSVSSTGRNASAKGFMGMIADIFSGAVHSFGRVMDAYGRETVRYGIVHAPGVSAPSADGMTPIWTLQAYRDDLERQRGDDEAAEAAWDALEKSIVGRLADDVVVGVKGDRIELAIIKDFA